MKQMPDVTIELTNILLVEKLLQLSLLLFCVCRINGSYFRKHKNVIRKLSPDLQAMMSLLQ